MNSHEIIREAFHKQAGPCRDLGSPFTARLCELWAARMQPGNMVDDALLAWPGESAGTGDALALRLTGALNALVIEGLAPDLAAAWPPHHERLGDDALWPLLEEVSIQHADFIIERLQSAPQTNEVRRSSILLPGFWQIAKQTGLPLVLSELGASAGLNLHFDQFHYDFGDQHWGRENSLVRLAAEWTGPPAQSTSITVRSRAGCDLNPLNPSSIEERNRLMSYIWPDQAERISRTKAAIDIAAASDIRVEKADAIVWLEKRLGERHENAVHVVFHTIAWQYFPYDAQEKGRALMAAAGEKATKDAPLAWLRFEMDEQKPGAAITLTMWPSGQETYLGRADFHGRWIEWR
jgi:hypothetical protein